MADDESPAGRMGLARVREILAPFDPAECARVADALGRVGGSSKSDAELTGLTWDTVRFIVAVGEVRAVLAEVPAELPADPPGLADLKVYAWIGLDELGSGELGIKQGLVAAGNIPLVSLTPLKIRRPALLHQLQSQASRYGQTIALVRLGVEGIEHRVEPAPSIVCPQCSRRSFHPEDIRQRYCGACHQFHDEMARLPDA